MNRRKEKGVRREGSKMGKEKKWISDRVKKISKEDGDRKRRSDAIR